MKKIILAIAAMILLAVPAYALKVDDPAPSFTLTDRGGNEFRLGEFSGATRSENARGVVLSFFASWCIPCRNELPLINAQVDELRRKGVTVVIVGVREEYGEIGALLADLKVDRPRVLSDREGTVSAKYGLRGLPTTFFIGADGTVKEIIFGEIKDAKELRDGAMKLFK